MNAATPHIPLDSNELCLPTREAPAEVVRPLRAIDPRAELVYVGLGTWALGEYKPDEHERRRRAHDRLRQLRSPGKRRMYQLARRGFALIDTYTEAEVLSGWIVRDYRERTFRYLADREAEARRAFALAEGDARRETAAAATRDAAAASSEDHGWIFDRKRHYPMHARGAA